MTKTTTVALPEQTKQRLDKLHLDLHITEGVPRWQTIEQALELLANDEGVDLDPNDDDSVDNETGSKRRVRGR